MQAAESKNSLERQSYNKQKDIIAYHCGGPMKAAMAESPTQTQTQPIVFPGAWPGAWTIDEEESRAVREVIEAQSLFRHYGPKVLGKVAAFEKAFAAKTGTRFALGVTSGTGALMSALVGLEIGPEDEVIMPCFPWIANACAAVLVGAVPVLAEIDESLNLDPKDIERHITRHTKAIMVVHTSGVPADMDPIMDVARRHGIKVIEDGAQSCGGSYHGRRVGSIADAGAFSFQTNKIMTTGEGGAVTLSDPSAFERAIRYHDLGSVRPSFGIEAKGKGFFGNNYRMSELTGAVALVQLGKLDGIIGRMRTIKAAIVDGIRDLPGLTLRKYPDPSGDAAATITFFAPSAEMAEQAIAALAPQQVPCAKPYGGKTLYELWPDHFQSWLAERKARDARSLKQNYGPGLCPRSEGLLRRALALPLTPYLTQAHIERAIVAIRNAWQLK
jgi:8-amino-3,8-dideoxy-alpha-D-manno-octulosonate transaminase